MHIKVLKAHQYAIVVCKTGGCVSGDTSRGVCNKTTESEIVELAVFNNASRGFCFSKNGDYDINKLPIKHLEIIIAIRIWYK